MSSVTFTMNNQKIIPALGLGTFRSEEGEVYQAVRQAIEIGYRHFDCAWIYANEKEIGQALADAIKVGDVTRDELFITSKLWNDSHGKGNVSPALDKSLSLLQLDYLDLYLIHWPVSFVSGVEFPKSQNEIISNNFPRLLETWAEMEYCVDQGKIRSIGVSNFSISKLERLLINANIIPVINQVELHPYLQQNDLLDYCAQHNILLTAYSPLGSQGRNVSSDHQSILAQPIMKEISQKHNITEAQVLLAWAINRGTIVIPKSVNAKRLEENYHAQFISLDQEDMEKINALDQSLRYIDGSFCAFDNSEFTIEAIWR
ncbi:aldo/keto reductase [Thiotrichales bacterium 19S11-10]|nr:aldo/keto reductase [Thiotrichales bacterium 19S11-10]